MKPIKIKTINNWREFPDSAGDSKTKAMGSPKTRTVYVVKGKTTQSEQLHEVGHIVKRHSDDWNYKANNYIKEEIEANLYAYKRTNGKPKHIEGQLRGLVIDLVDHYQLTPKNSMKIICKWVSASKVPTWKDDYALLAKEIKKHMVKEDK